MAGKLGEVKRGDRVKILDSGGMVGRIVDYRGPLGPNGTPIYRVRIPRKPKPRFVEVREDQLERVIEEQTPSQ